MDISAFFSGEVAPFWPHITLIAVAVFGSAAVAWEIIREADRIWSLTTLLVVIGVAVEAICTILLFGFDEGIASRQQDTIIALTRALSPRVLEQNLAAQALKPFSNVEVLVLSDSDSEPRRTAGQIRWMLNAAGWKRFSGTLDHSRAFFDEVVIHGANKPAIDALIKQLDDNGIEARPGYSVPELGSNGVLVLVGAKPIPSILLRQPNEIPGDSRGKMWGNVLE